MHYNHFGVKILSYIPITQNYMMIISILHGYVVNYRKQITFEVVLCADLILVNDFI